VPFFTLLANRKFPVTDWIRKPEEFDYIVEPDVFHDLFGHVPLLFNPGVRRPHAGIRQGRLEGTPAGRLRAAQPAVLVHDRVRADPPAGRDPCLWRGHPELGRRTSVFSSQPRAAAACRWTSSA
jgi:hypothetical protein